MAREEAVAAVPQGNLEGKEERSSYFGWSEEGGIEETLVVETLEVDWMGQARQSNLEVVVERRGRVEVEWGGMEEVTWKDGILWVSECAHNVTQTNTQCIVQMS